MPRTVVVTRKNRLVLENITGYLTSPVVTDQGAISRPTPV